MGVEVKSEAVSIDQSTIYKLVNAFLSGVVLTPFTTSGI